MVIEQREPACSYSQSEFDIGMSACGLWIALKAPTRSLQRQLVDFDFPKTESEEAQRCEASLATILLD
jgi:hypothetical protein